MTAPFDIGVHCDYFLSMAGGQVQPERDIFVGIKGNRITEVSRWSPGKASLGKTFIHAHNKVALPGLVNGHAHLAMSLFRGLEDDRQFHEWLFDRIIPLEAQLVDREFVRVGTELSALECIRFGVTTVMDMYFHANTIAEVLDRAGIRGLVSQVFASNPLPEDKDLGSDKTILFEYFNKKYAGHERIIPVLGPHAPYTCSDETLKKVAQLAEKHGSRIHIHLCETRNEVEESLKTHGKTPVKRLFDLGILQQRTICAHCVHMDEQDIAIMKQAGASVVYNPDSNMKLSSGIAPIPSYRANGIPVAFGTDGAASNNDMSLFGAMDIGTKLQKLARNDNTAMVAEQALLCATLEGARALGLDDRIGSLEVGKEADLILVDLNFPHLHPVHDIRSQLVYSTQGLEVDTVICQGKVLMKDKKIQVLDSNKTLKEAERFKTKIQAALKQMSK